MKNEPRRPNPDELLARIRAQAHLPYHENGRGDLRLYLGAAPGVGKTYAMLAEAHRLTEQGVDVVVGFVETHGRTATEALVQGLEIIPRLQITYRGVTVEEMDTDALLARRPRVALVDELAHTNAPGSPRAKRYEDVQALLGADINVISTLNIQHLESLHDVVAGITGIRQRETIPDSVLDAASEVQLVDVPPDVLQERLRRGEIYPAVRARQALENFFRTGNLTALRELALRRVAEGVDAKLETYMDDHAITAPWRTAERVMVCVDHRPVAETLIRHAWRLVRGLKADFLVVTVRTADDLTPEKQANLQKALELAEDLGATVVTLDGRDIAETLATFAQEQRVTQMVIGHPQKSRWEEMVRGSTVNRILRLCRTVDILVVADDATT
jgi:two-component system, OmpR family, sensor histidine kinase KdpD